MSVWTFVIRHSSFVIFSLFMSATLHAKDALTAGQLLQRMYDHLKPYVELAQRGHLSVARDPYEVVEQLGQAPGSFRCILLWSGEKMTDGTNRDSGIVTHEFLVTVSHNRGLSLISGASAFLPRNNDTAPLVTLHAAVRDKLRGMRFDDGVTDRILTYRGCDPVALDGKPIDAFTQTWNLTAILPPQIH